MTDHQLLQSGSKNENPCNLAVQRYDLRDADRRSSSLSPRLVCHHPWAVFIAIPNGPELCPVDESEDLVTKTKSTPVTPTSQGVVYRSNPVHHGPERL